MGHSQVRKDWERESADSYRATQKPLTVEVISGGVDCVQRNFEPIRRQVETWRAHQLTNATAKLIVYRAFIEDELDAPKHLARRVHQLYFAPEHEDFQPRTMWSLFECLCLGIQETGSHSAVQADGEAWILSGADVGA